MDDNLSRIDQKLVIKISAWICLGPDEALVAPLPFPFFTCSFLTWALLISGYTEYSAYTTLSITRSMGKYNCYGKWIWLKKTCNVHLTYCNKTKAVQ